LVGSENFFKIKILIFLILVSPIYSQGENTIELPYWYIQNYDKELQDIWKEYQPLALIAVLASFTIASFLYGLGIMLNNERLRNYGMAELLESVASLLMVGFFIILLQILVHTFFPVVTEGATPEQQQLIKVGPFAYLDAKLAMIQKISNKTFVQIIYVLEPLYFISSVKIEPAEADITSGLQAATLLGGVFTEWVQRFLSIFIGTLVEFANYIFSGLKALSFQRALLKFFGESALTVFLPLGVVLRIFPPTRGAGGMLIAMAFSFFFVFPSIYLIFYLPSGPSSLYQVLMTNLAAINQKLDELNSSQTIKLIKFFINNFGLVAILTTLIRTIPLLANNLFPLFSLFISYFPTYLFVTSIIPVIAGALTLTFIATLSELFGENAVSYGQKLIGRIL